MTENTTASNNPESLLKSTNPKDRIGIHKPPIHLIPASALIHESMAFLDGAVKYGPYNWRGEAVSASVYLAAAMRHILAWQDGEENSRDANRHHLGHARACLAILLDAQSIGKLVDDRPQPGAASDLIDKLTGKKAAPTPKVEEFPVLPGGKPPA